MGAHRREASTEMLAKPVRLLPHRGGIIPILRMGGGEIGIDLLVQAIVSRVQGTTPIGKSFARLESAQGQVVSKSDQDLVFERLCVQMLQRTRPSMCPGYTEARGTRWQEALDECRRRKRAGIPQAS